MILVFGKSGQVATELQSFNNIVAISRDQADLSNPSSCSDAIKTYEPEAVINAAAYTAVDKAETEEALATVINGEAPTAMAHACADLKIPLVHISSDYVFNGKTDTPWQPIDKTEPQNAYGRSKKIGEEGIRKTSSTHAILRTSWVFSAHGSNFVKTMIKLAEEKEELHLVADQFGGPTPAKDIAKACIQIAEQLLKNPRKSGTYHFSGAPDVSWAYFATKIFERVGRTVNVVPVPTSDYPTTATRPLNSRLDCRTTKHTFLIDRPNWRIGLNNILNELEVVL